MGSEMCIRDRGLVHVLFGNVHDPDLEHLVSFGIVDKIVQSTPRAFQLLEIRVVQDLVDLLGQLLVDLSDDAFDRAQRVV